MRRCVGCGESKPKGELVRIAVGENGPALDKTGRADGRGLYICRGSEDCLKLAIKKRAIPRLLNTEFTDEQMKKLEEDYKSL